MSALLTLVAEVEFVVISDPVIAAPAVVLYNRAYAVPADVLILDSK